MTTTTEPTKVPQGDAGTDGTPGTDSAPVPALRAATFAAGTAKPAAAPAERRTGTPGTGSTGTTQEDGSRWWPFGRRGPRSGTGTTHAETTGPVPTLAGGTGPAGHPGTTEAGTSAGTSPAEAARTEAAFLAAARTAHAGTTTAKRAKARTGTDGAELPVPPWARTLGAYGSWLLGELPLIAPMIVSGWYTFHVGTQSLNQPWPIALLLTAALEGVAFKLAKLYEKRLVAGLSTIAERLGLMGVVAAIAALIYWHATNQAGGLDNWQQADWRPASVAAAMSAIGVFVYGRSARWSRRAELMAEGRVDMQALRIGVWQWIVSPWESLWGFRHGMKNRIGNPADAVRDWRLWKEAGKPKAWPPALADVLGTDGTRRVEVPVWLLETLQAGVGTGTGVPARTPGTKQAAGTNPPGGTGTAGTSGTGTAGGGTSSGTDNGGGDPGDPSGTGTADQDGPTAVELAAWRERHRERLITVRNNIRAKDGSDNGWDTMPEADLSLSRIISASGGEFSNKTIASQIQQILLNDRRQMEASA